MENNKYIKVFEVKFRIDDYIKALEELKSRIDELKERQKELRREGKASSREYVKNQAQIKQLSQTYRTLEKQVIANARAEKKHTELIQVINAELKKEVKSIEQLDKQTRTLNLMKRQLNFENEAERELIEKINEKIKENVEMKRKLEDVDTKRIMNIGRYVEALREVLGDKAELLKLGSQEIQIYNVVKVVISQTSKRFKILGAIMRRLPILAIVGAFLWLISTIRKSMAGIQRVRKIVYPVSKVFQVFSNRIKQVAIGLFDLGKSIVNLNWEGMKNAVRQTTNQFVGLGKAISDAYNEGKKIANLTNEIERMGILMNKLVADNNYKIALLEKQLAGVGNNYVKQAKIITEINRLENENLNIKERQLRKKLEIAKIEAKSGEAEKIKEMMQLSAELQNIQTERVRMQASHVAKMKEIQKKAVEESIALLEHKLNVMYKKEVEHNKLAEAEDMKSLEMRYQVWKNYFEEKEKLIEEKEKKGLISKRQAELMRIDLENEKKMLDEAYNERLEYFQQKEVEFQTRKKEIEIEIKEMLAEVYAEDEDLQIQLIEARKDRELAVWQKYYEENLINEETFLKIKQAINEKYENAIVELRKKSADAQKETEKEKLANFEKTASAIGKTLNILFKDNKDVAVAVATIDTLYSAQKAFRLELDKGDPFATIRAFAVATTVLASGFERVRRIMQTNIGGGGKGSSISQMNLPTTIGGTTSRQSQMEVNTGVNAGNVNATDTANRQTIRVINVARDTTDMASEEIFVENARDI